MESFISKYKVSFDEKQNCWKLKIPPEDVERTDDGSYLIRLPAYASYVLQPGGNIMRPLTRKYRDFLLEKQNGVCAVCGEGYRKDDYFCLDHQPPMADHNSKAIDYEGKTANRVIHKSCDPAQNKKQKTVK